MMKKEFVTIFMAACLLVFPALAAGSGTGSSGDIPDMTVTLTATVHVERSLPVVTVGSRTYTLVSMMPERPADKNTDGGNPPSSPNGREPLPEPAGGSRPHRVPGGELHLLVGRRVTFTGFFPPTKDDRLYFVVLSYTVKD